MRPASIDDVTSLDSPQLITVGYDGSSLSELCIHRALRCVEGAPLATVHIVCVAQREGGRLRMPDGTLLTHWAAIESLRYIVTRLSLEHGTRDLPGGIYAHIRTGHPAREIVDLAYRYHSDLIMVGANGQTGTQLVGNVAREVLSLSEIPAELQTPLQAAAASAPFNPLRFAYVFSGTTLREKRLSVGVASRS